MSDIASIRSMVINYGDEIDNKEVAMIRILASGELDAEAEASAAQWVADMDRKLTDIELLLGRVPH